MKRSSNKSITATSIALTIILLASIVSISIARSKRVERQDDPTLKIGDRLQNELNRIVSAKKTKFPGALIYINGPEFGTWTGAAGLSDAATSAKAIPYDKFRAGSIMKPFISTVVLQLIEEGKLKLDDTMPNVLPKNITGKFVNSDKITVRMLLNHTSGIAECFDRKTHVQIASSPRKIWKMEEYLDISSAHGPDFMPGERGAYSNTNYILLGMIVAQATGNTWRDEVRNRIVKPLKLQNTFLPEPGDLSIPGDYLHGYMKIHRKIVDVTELDPSMADAAGGGALVTTAEDLSIFMSALLNGKLFGKKESLENMLKFLDVPKGRADPAGWIVGYGLGITRIVFPGGIEGIGHGGETAGYSSFVYYLPSKKITIAGAVNTSGWMDSHVQLLAPLLEILNSKG